MTKSLQNNTAKKRCNRRYVNIDNNVPISDHTKKQRDLLATPKSYVFTADEVLDADYYLCFFFSTQFILLTYRKKLGAFRDAENGGDKDSIAPLPWNILKTRG